MYAKISNEITIFDPTPEVVNWVKKHLEFSNPNYIKKQRMGFWVGGTPKTLRCFRVDGNNIVVPYGLIEQVTKWCDVTYDFAEHKKLKYFYFVNLYPYQRKAVTEMINRGFGILSSPAGSGKTQMGLAIAMQYQTPVLWLTHTHDLLNQSYERAKQFCSERLLGTITEGLYKIGEAITFATVQTLANGNLNLFKNRWDVIVVDECHRVATSDMSVTQMQKVLESLAAKHKFGLSATVHRADGLIQTTFALLGDITYEVPESECGNRIVKANILPRKTPIKLDFNFDDGYMNIDGTINFVGLATYIATNKERNDFIVNDLKNCSDRYCLILSNRLEQLNYLKSHFSDNDSVLIDGKKNKEVREKALQDLRDGKKHYLFATYKLAKEGLDIPRLDTLFLATPEKDYAIIVQSVGRVSRAFEGKEQPIVYDYIDDTKIFVKYWSARKSIYKKEGCCILE